MSETDQTSLPRAGTPARPVVWAVLWAAVCGALYATLSVLRHRRFEVTSWDNAIFEQAVRGYAGLGAPIIDVKGPGFNQLGDHFSPILVLLAPFYRVVPAAETLLVAQAVLLAISVAVVSSLALRRLGTRVGGVLALCYGLSFGLVSAVAVDFHEVAFGAPLLALAGAAYVDRRWTQVVLWTLPLMLVKEDLGLTVAAVGVVLWLAGQRRRGVLLAVVGVVGAALVVLVWLPAFNPAGVYEHGAKAGGDVGLALSLFVDVERKLLTVLVTFGVTGLAALFSRWALLVLPTFAWRFVGDVEFYWGTEWHYSVLLMPIVFVAAVDAIQRHRELRWAAVPAAVVTVVMLVGSPMADLVDGQTYREGPREAAAQEALSLVPEDATVITDLGLMTHLTTDRDVFWIGSVAAEDGVDPDYVVLDQVTGIGSPPDPLDYATTMFGGSWELLLNTDGYQVAARTG